MQKNNETGAMSNGTGAQNAKKHRTDKRTDTARAMSAKKQRRKTAYIEHKTAKQRRNTFTDSIHSKAKNKADEGHSAADIRVLSSFSAFVSDRF